MRSARAELAVAPPIDATVADTELTRLRRRIRALDRRLIALVAERIELCLRVGRIKHALDLPVRNRAVEAEVYRNARETARRFAVSAELAEALMRTVIEYAVRAQDRAR